MSFYGTVLYTVHLLLRLLAFLRHWLQVGGTTLAAVRNRHNGGDVGLMQHLIGQLQLRRRLPTHIALVLQEELRYTDLGALVVWCMAAGITFITVYDHQGIIKQNIQVLRNCVASHQKKLFGKSSSNYIIKDCNANGWLKSKDEENTFKINVLSCSDGRGDIVNAAKLFAKGSVVSNADGPRVVDTKQLESLFKSNRNMPLPDLLVSFGPSYSTFGFLPWHLHLTEILHLETHHHIRFPTFHESLLRFAACEQRFGK